MSLLTPMLSIFLLFGNMRSGSFQSFVTVVYIKQLSDLTNVAFVYISEPLHGTFGHIGNSFWPGLCDLICELLIVSQGPKLTL